MIENRNQHLFILCTNNGGSTLLAKILSACRNVISLDSPLQEGHLVKGIEKYLPTPAIHKCVAVWTEKAYVFEDNRQYRWKRIKYMWTKSWQNNSKYRTANPRLLFEKSPPNLLRASLLEKVFSDSYFIIMVRNPYAVAEGIRRRNKHSLDRCIKHWISASEKQIENIKTLKNQTWFTYEQLCEDPQSIKKQLIEFIPKLDDLDMNRSVKVHSIQGTIESGIKNYNAEQISKLSTDDISLINSYLEKHQDVLHYFGYQLLS